MGLETGWNCHISLTPNGDVPGSEIPPSSPSHAGSLHDDLHQGENCALATLNAMCFLGGSFKPFHRFLCPHQTPDPWELWAQNWMGLRCVCKWQHFTFIAFLARQYQVFGNRHPSVHQLPWIYVLMSASGSCWGPGQATEGPLPVHYSFFLTSAGISLFSSPRRTAEQKKYHFSKEQGLGSHIYLWTD